MKKLSLTLAIASIFAIAIFQLSRPIQTENSNGSIRIVVVDELGVEVINEIHDFEQDQTVYDVLQEHYVVGCSSKNYTVDYDCDYTSFGNHIILVIDDVQTDWYGSYLQIFIGDEPSVKGVDTMGIVDGEVYTFRYTNLGGDQ